MRNKIKLCFILKAGTTLNVNMIRENGKVNRADFDLNLELSSILNDFDKIVDKNTESTQVNISH